MAPLAPALVAGGVMVGAVFFNSTAESNGTDLSPFLHPQPRLSPVFSLTATQEEPTRARTAQAYEHDSYCNPETDIGRAACCYYYGYYCDPEPSEQVFADREEGDVGGGFARAGKPFKKPTISNFLF